MRDFCLALAAWLVLAWALPAQQVYDERSQLNIQRSYAPAQPTYPPQQLYGNGGGRPTPVGVPYVTEETVYDTLPPHAPPGSLTVAQMHYHAAQAQQAQGAAGRYASGVPGNPNCPCVAMGGCGCQNCQCDAVRAGYVQARGGMPGPASYAPPPVQYQQPMYAAPAYAQPVVRYAQPAPSYYPAPAAYAQPMAYGAPMGSYGGYGRPSVTMGSYGARGSMGGGGCANGQCGVGR